ncbi:MAG TPA: GGDEF domain-containing protein [Dehalococcoidia bacterium]|nr:GGDEF domain-containing protein [Dehalococcoidia bacterium]
MIAQLPPDDERRPKKMPLGPILTFAFVGVGFAFVTYAAVTWLYVGEFFNRNDTSGLAITSYLFSQKLPAFLQLPAFLPWLASCTGFFALIGYLFDRQRFNRWQAEQLLARSIELAATDDLTGVYNHRIMLHQLRVEIGRIKRGSSHALALLFIDIDDFKHYNDAYGHLAGDAVLQSLADTLTASVRETDVVGRYGGEEFLIIAVGADREAGRLLAERVRTAIEHRCPITVSIGVAQVTSGEAGDVDTLLAQADQAMYLAKEGGRNQVQVYSPDISAASL